MKKISYSFNIYVSFIVGVIFVLGSCAPEKNVIYFQNIHKDTTLNTLVNNNSELKIRKNDLLSINIISPDPVSTPLFNNIQTSLSSGAGPGNSGGGPTGGYLVDKDGNIIMYKLGLIHVEGMTRSELKSRLQKDLLPYLKDAVVTIRFLNNRITMLGELGQPGIITIPNEQVTLLEALGMAGDISISGRKDNVLVIRETSTGKQFKRLNLTDKSIFYSPFYYLKPDDVVYVEPTTSKIKSTSQTQQVISYVISAFSILVSILSFVSR